MSCLVCEHLSACHFNVQAAMAYLQHRGMMIHCHCDKVHRLIRDIRLAMQCDPRFEDARLATTYAFGVNYKPLSSGAFGDEKHELLSSFFDTCIMEDGF